MYTKEKIKESYNFFTPMTKIRSFLQIQNENQSSMEVSKGILYIKGIEFSILSLTEVLGFVIEKFAT